MADDSVMDGLDLGIVIHFRRNTGLDLCYRRINFTLAPFDFIGIIIIIKIDICHHTCFLVIVIGVAVQPEILWFILLNGCPDTVQAIYRYFVIAKLYRTLIIVQLVGQSKIGFPLIFIQL
ncbi:hypothetical protein SDC9_171602 [bioreactor metagenome]|uniref:Uncharacterized protein n=1 Tax=bioreactor metagenome TaxID=1076179 RepID=A0A645GBB3_9ZZZZ